MIGGPFHAAAVRDDGHAEMRVQDCLPQFRSCPSGHELLREGPVHVYLRQLFLLRGSLIPAYVWSGLSMHVAYDQLREVLRGAGV